MCTLITVPTFAFSVRDFLYPSYTTDQWAGIVLDKLRWIYLIKPTSRENTFSTWWTSAKKLWQAQVTSWTIIINAGYFGRNNDWYFPAGHFAIDLSPVDQSWCERDLNLCWFVFTDSLQIAQWLTFTKEPTFAAGPILMLDGKVNKDVQNNNSHRTYKKYRTILISTKQWPIFLITKKQYSLDRILAYSVNYFGRNISVINLDGWSSTTLWTDNPTFQFNASKTLPAFFILK